MFSRSVTAQVSGGMRRSVSGAAQIGVALRGGDSGHGARQLPAEGLGELVSRQRGAGGGQRGQHGERVGLLGIAPKGPRARSCTRAIRARHGRLAWSYRRLLCAPHQLT
jgi:hypothetical protein